MTERSSSTLDDVRLSTGNARDLDDVIKVMDAAFDDRFGEAWTRSQCAGILPMPGVRLVLARARDGKPAGFSLFRTVADDAELLLIAVAPQFRRQGVGRMLLDQFLDQARDVGASRVHLEVREGNPAILMYRAAGFSSAGRRRKYYRGRGGGEFDALTLSRDF
ncbi:MAG: GNAT family N-acetyltransferase [Pseudomonadota bacterium]|nr:GNAT family N-acetyltransferase [Pseudomonadota bacterium]